MKTTEGVGKERAEELLSYDASTGVLTWRESRGGTRAGDVAGTIHRQGYREVKIDGRLYKAHRVIAVLQGWDIEGKEIDHINGIRHDNRLSNLRLVTKQENQRNRKINANNKSGCPGVYWNRRDCKWQVGIRVSGRVASGGYFASKEDAIAKAEAMRAEFGFHENHGRS